MSIEVSRKIIFIIILAVVLLLGLGAAFWLKPKEMEFQLENLPVKPTEPIEQRDLELLCAADTEEEAEKLAEDYGIELISFDSKIAVFQTDKAYEEIVEIGKEKGLPELSRNNIMRAY